MNKMIVRVKMIAAQPQTFESSELAGMVASFKKVGMINPLILYRTEPGKESYLLVGGQKEYAAVIEANIKKVDAFVFEDLGEAKEICKIWGVDSLIQQPKKKVVKKVVKKVSKTTSFENWMDEQLGM